MNDSPGGFVIVTLYTLDESKSIEQFEIFEPEEP